MPQSETKWTPGPWQWETADGVARLRQSGRIGTCPNFDRQDPIIDDGSAGGEYERTIEPDSPNAVLIEAAPDLYAALEEGRDVLCWLKLHHLTAKPLSIKTTNAAIQRCNAALAKARGETPDAPK